MPPQPLTVLAETVPVARPPTAALVGLAAVAEVPVEEPWLTRRTLKGWATSVSLHSALLIVMALWYFVPKATAPRVIDSRLAGSNMGVEEGLSATGGLSTPIELQASPTPAPDPTPIFKPAELGALEARLSNLSGAWKSTGGGGVDNPNPGAGNGDGFGLARFGDGGESIRGVEVKVGDPQFTLLWDTEADLDLHVIEPGGKEIYWQEPNGKQGGELDVDNTKGYGPENIYWLHEDEKSGKKVKGSGPAGEYKWFVFYWGGFGGVAKPTRWKVRIKHDDKITVVTGRLRALNEKSRVYGLKIAPPAEDSDVSKAR